MANGPAGRKCCTARPRCGFSWLTVVTMPTCAILPAARRRCRRPRAGASRGRPRQPAAARAAGGRPASVTRDAVLIGVIRRSGRCRRAAISAAPRAGASQDRSRQPFVLDECRSRARRPRRCCHRRRGSGRNGVLERGVGDVDGGDGLACSASCGQMPSAVQQALASRPTRPRRECRAGAACRRTARDR